MTGRIPGAFRSTAIAVIAYGIAMGYLEAAVVVYLQAALVLAPASLARSTTRRRSGLSRASRSRASSPRSS